MKLEYKVSVFNRGHTPDDLPAEVERLRGDRTDPEQLKTALGGREFDVIVDTTIYTGAEADTVVELFSNRVGRYIFLSTGQVYLVRTGVERPFKEEDYPGPVMPAPLKADASEYKNWLYGFDKREAEDVLTRAWQQRQFPVTSLRLPMVNSERDHYDRIYGYFLRLQDGGPILVPTVGLPLRHVYGEDVTQAIMALLGSDKGRGAAYNIAQDETFSLEEFLQLLARLAQRPLKLIKLPRETLDRAGLLPHCSPFSDPWMSSLDNAYSKTELGIKYTSVAVYLEKLVRYFHAASARKTSGYAQRDLELKIAGAQT